ncbi:MAG: hypothetical protein QOJ03_186 [Frankiaceae bacterium]|jgi:hypothetical protein|nr:hypothetical protein [Frankiaceae bacterium]
MLQLVGAGVGRTGTNSLKVALERLLDAPCYHMIEVFEHIDHVATWHAAIRGEQVDWTKLLDGYAAIVDWPGAACWRDIANANPDAVVLLSRRSDAATWWASASATIMSDVSEEEKQARPELEEFGAMIGDMFAAFEPGWRDPEVAMAAYDRHNEAVRREVPADRLVEWQPGDGWEPLCQALGVAVPDEPFPHTNSTAEFTARRAERLAENG